MWLQISVYIYKETTGPTWTWVYPTPSISKGNTPENDWCEMEQKTSIGSKSNNNWYLYFGDTLSELYVIVANNF